MRPKLPTRAPAELGRGERALPRLDGTQRDSRGTRLSAACGAGGQPETQPCGCRICFTRAGATKVEKDALEVQATGEAGVTTSALAL